MEVMLSSTVPRNDHFAVDREFEEVGRSRRVRTVNGVFEPDLTAGVDWDVAACSREC